MQVEIRVDEPVKYPVIAIRKKDQSVVLFMNNMTNCVTVTGKDVGMRTSEVISSELVEEYEILPVGSAVTLIQE